MVRGEGRTAAAGHVEAEGSSGTSANLDQKRYTTRLQPLDGVRSSYGGS